MAQADDGIGTPELGLVDGFLHRIVQLPAVLAAQDIIDVAALGFVHEVGRGRFGECFRGGHAHKGDPAAAHAEEFDRGQHPEPGAQVDPVAGDVRELCFPEDSLSAGHAVVELMVAGGGQIVARLIHQLDDGGTVVHGAVGRTLDMVTGIHQQDIPAGVLDALFQGGNGGIGRLGGFVVDVGMDIVGVEDGHIGLIAKKAIGFFGKCGRCPYGDRGQRRGSTGSFQKAAAGNELFHRK